MKRALVLSLIVLAASPLTAQNYSTEDSLHRQVREDRERREAAHERRKQNARANAAEDRAAEAEAIAEEALSIARQRPRVVYVQPAPPPPVPTPSAVRESVMSPHQLDLAHDRWERQQSAPDFSFTRQPDGRFLVSFRGRPPLILSAEETARILKSVTEAVTDQPAPSAP
jgi:hypothetical protein